MLTSRSSHVRKAHLTLLCFFAAMLLVGSTTARSQEVRFPTGDIEASPEELEAVPVARRYRDFTPPRIDLTKFTPVPGKQVDSSCVGWAVAYAARTMHFAWDNKSSSKSLRNIASPSALYNSIIEPGACMGGSRIPDALTFLKVVGVPNVEQFPPNSRDECARQIAEDDYPAAERFKIKDFYRISPGDDITRIRSQLAQFKPVIFAMPVPASFFNPSDKSIFRDTRNTDGGHAMTIIGYDDNKPGGGAFKIINSWGTAWGNNGYRWIAYDTFKELVKYSFVMDTRPLDSPRPKPAPDPPPITTDDPQLAEMERILGEHECSGVSAYDDIGKSLSAFTKTEEAAGAANISLRQAFPDFRIDVDVAPWPQCEVLLTLKDQLESPQRMRLLVNGMAAGEDPPVLKEGDKLVFDITTPDFPSYIYAAYLETDNEGKHEVIHLVQSTNPYDQYAPNTHIRMGDGEEGRDLFEIAGPNFGPEMILLIASASPLFEAERPWSEIERDYLSAIRDALIKTGQAGGTRQITARLFNVVTQSADR